MSKQIKDKNATPSEKLWRQALIEANEQLEMARQRVRQLETTVRVFQENLKSGLPFPTVLR